MYPIFGISPEWWLVIIVGVVGMIVQGRLQSVFAKYSKVPFPSGMTGRDVAEKMLRDNGIYDVKVTSTPGHLTDHFNPQNKTVNLSQGVYNSNSISAAAVAAHECGHAVQHAKGYAPLKFRSAIVPVISVASKWANLTLLAGVVVMAMSTGKGVPLLFWIGIMMVALVALFSIVTLPVEYNASSRALAWLQSSGTLNQQQLGQAREALRWAARTYLVAALSAIATLLYYLSIVRRN